MRPDSFCNKEPPFVCFLGQRDNYIVWDWGSHTRTRTRTRTGSPEWPEGANLLRDSGLQPLPPVLSPALNSHAQRRQQPEEQQPPLHQCWGAVPGAPRESRWEAGRAPLLVGSPGQLALFSLGVPPARLGGRGVRSSSSRRWRRVHQWPDCLLASGLLSTKGYHVSWFRSWLV